MKIKITLFAIAFFALQLNLLAQDGCGCEPVSTPKQLFVSFCDAGDGWPHPDNPDIFEYDSVQNVVYGVLNYTEVTCGDYTGIFINSFFLYNSTDFYINNYPNFGFNCRPANYNTYIEYLKEAIRQLLGGNTGIYEVAFEKGCMSLSTVEWPEDTCYFFSVEGPPTVASYPLNSYGSTALLACEGTYCCKITYEIDASGHMTPIGTAGSSAVCDQQLLETTPKIHCYDKSGNPITHEGTITEEGPCESYCFLYDMTRFKTDMSPKDAQYKEISPALDFNVKPTLAHAYVNLSSIKGIQKVVIVNAEGKELQTIEKLTSATIDIQHLKPGLLYLQIHFEDANIRLIKILKQ